MERLQKIIAASGLCSRRAAEELILAGKVRVNGKIVRELGTQAAPTDTIAVNERPLPKPHRVVYAVHKPRGVVCTRSAQDESPIITDLVPHYPAVYPVGRLDKDSEGLILLTNDGALTATLTHPKHLVSKRYRILARKKLEAKQLTAAEIERKLANGISLSDGKLQANNIRITLQGTDFLIDLTIHEGRQHVLRRACSVLGLNVKRLARMQIGSLTLAKIPLGKYRLLSDVEIAGLLPKTHEA